jgi:hypothetical protein
MSIVRYGTRWRPALGGMDDGFVHRYTAEGKAMLTKRRVSSFALSHVLSIHAWIKKGSSNALPSSCTRATHGLVALGVVMH